MIALLRSLFYNIANTQEGKMDIKLLQNIDYEINQQSMMKRLRIEEDDDIKLFNEMLDTIKSIAKPKTIFAEAYITDKFEEGVKIDNKIIECKLMRKNLEDSNRVFPYIATCGRELYNWAKTIDDFFVAYWADCIMQAYLMGAMTELKKVIKNQYGVTKLSSMNPGSLPGWPIDRQRELFELLENKNEDIGVELTDSFLMIPNKSSSGILFKSKTGYSNCKLCERLNCPTRRDAFNKDLKIQLTGE